MLLVNMIFNTIQSTTLFSLCKTTSGKSETTRFFSTRLYNLTQTAMSFGVGTPIITYRSAKLLHSTRQSHVNGQTVEDFTHANTLDWDYNNSIIYLNLRNTNTFYKINQTTGNIIWACGEFGNFTLLGANGQPLVGANGLPPSLWYHSHDVKEVAPDVFTMFDNDYENNTNPDDCHSRMIRGDIKRNKHDSLCKLELGSPNAILEQLCRRNPASSKRRLS